MSAIDLKGVDAYLHFETYERVLSNTWKFSFYNIQFPDNHISEKDTLFGFFVPCEYVGMTLGQFVKLMTKKEFQKGTICILRFCYLDTEDFFKPNFDSKQVSVSSEPVLIDPDYQDNLFCAQFSISGATNDFIVKSSKRFFYTLEMKEPLFPAGIDRACPYTPPLINTMRPADIEEFYNDIFYNQILVTDFILVRSSSEAAGYDIELGVVLDNSKDFTCVGEYKEANKDKFTVKAKYLYDLIFPYFFAQPFEMNGRTGDFMLRSSISRRGVTLTWTVLDDQVDSTKGQTVQLTIHNQNNYDITFSRESNKHDPTQFPFRFVQFVPSLEFQYYLNKLPSAEDRSKFLGVTLVQNEKARKDKLL